VIEHFPEMSDETKSRCLHVYGALQYIFQRTSLREIGRHILIERGHSGTYVSLKFAIPEYEQAGEWKQLWMRLRKQPYELYTKEYVFHLTDDNTLRCFRDGNWVDALMKFVDQLKLEDAQKFMEIDDERLFKRGQKS